MKCLLSGYFMYDLLYNFRAKKKKAHAFRFNVLDLLLGSFFLKKKRLFCNNIKHFLQNKLPDNHALDL